MKLEITKEDFERVLPVGTSAHESLFEKLFPVIEEQKTLVASSLLGKVGEGLIERDANAAIKYYFKALVCTSAFLSVLHQLDLVLTPTGFGVISSEKYAPASKMRVDALDGELRNRECRYHGELVENLRGDEWGTTDQAATHLIFLYNRHEFFQLGNHRPTYNDWTAFFPTLRRADEILRSKIGDAQMEALLTAYRCRNRSVYTQQLEGSIFTFLYSMMQDGEAKAVTSPLRRIMAYIDSHKDIYTEWTNSKEYEAFHEERFKNTRDSAAYFFV